MKKNIVINVIGSLIIIGFLGKTYFEKNFHQEMAVYINDEYSTEFPKKGEALFSKAICNNDAKVSWNNDSWSLLINNLNQKTKCNLYFYQGETVFNFDYTGSEQTFVAPVSGTYKLETWGAQGGDTSENLHGGYGGYSGGLVELSENTKIYTNVGGAGEFMKKGLYAGGYNGGGGRLYGGAEAYAGSGGGATHMALITGLLSSLESVKDSILIVSGGGGGAKIYGSISNDDYSGIGGSGGGFVGENGIPVNNTVYGYGKGGTQNAGGGAEIIMNKNGLTYGSFGKGAVVNEPYENIYLVGAGGGGGYYGGGSIEHGPAAGGSGYIGNSLLKDKVMYCYNCEESNEESTKTISITCSEETPTANCSKKGNGYARITLVSIDE